jgi:hypothetical protein
LWDLKLKEHIVAQRAHQQLHYANRNLYISELEKNLTIIHNKMDHSKIPSPHFSKKIRD